MTSNKRNRDRKGMLQVSSSSPQPISDVESIDRQIYSTITQVDAGRQVADAVDIFEIVPDAMQPRRPVPFAVREAAATQEAPTLLQTWVDLVNVNRSAPVAVQELLTTVESELHPEVEDTEPLERSLLELIRLAASIRREGVTNPITIVPFGPHYRIETGERRWLACHLLYLYSGDDAYRRIPARVMDSFSIWRQASENNARENLNAVSRARQFALLLMDLWAQDAEKPRSFEPIDQFEHEQDFYAQVGDLRPPYGKRSILLSALGASTSAAFTRCRTLLTLPRSVWEIGDDLSLPEDTLLSLAKLPPETAIAHVQKLFDSKTLPLQEPQHNSRPAAPEIHQSAKKHLTWLVRHTSAPQHMTAQQRQVALERVDALQLWLDNLRAKLKE